MSRGDELAAFWAAIRAHHGDDVTDQLMALVDDDALYQAVTATRFHAAVSHGG